MPPSTRRSCSVSNGRRSLRWRLGCRFATVHAFERQIGVPAAFARGYTFEPLAQLGEFQPQVVEAIAWTFVPVSAFVVHRMCLQQESVPLPF